MSINNNDRLIFALDVPEASRAKELVLELGDSVSFYKIGMELMMTGDYFSLLDWLVVNEKKVFVDLKLFDVPATVSKAVKRLSQRGAYFTTIHGNQSMMEAAAAEKGNLKVLAVTALTSVASFPKVSAETVTETCSFSPQRSSVSRKITGSRH